MYEDMFLIIITRYRGAYIYLSPTCSDLCLQFWVGLPMMSRESSQGGEDGEDGEGGGCDTEEVTGAPCYREAGHG